MSSEMQFTETRSTETRTTEGYKVTSKVVNSISGTVQSPAPAKERGKPMSALGNLFRKVGSKLSDKLSQLLGNHGDEFELPFDLPVECSPTKCANLTAKQTNPCRILASRSIVHNEGSIQNFF